MVELLNTNKSNAMFCLLVLMCFGDKLEEEQIRKIGEIQRKFILSFPRFSILNFWPKIPFVGNFSTPARIQLPPVEEGVKEEDLQRVSYLNVMVLEGLRRHPPAHFVLPHSVTEEVELEGYVIPKNAMINFMVVDLGWDPKVWDDPMEFKPERFLSNGEETFDITGSREIKMKPFGAGSRICPGLALALLHLEYFVANLVWFFEWKGVEGDDVDLTEKQEFTFVLIVSVKEFNHMARREWSCSPGKKGKK